MLEQIRYGGWNNCYRLANDVVDLIVTADVGPRIIRFGFLDQVNMFKEFSDQLGKTQGDQWLPFGGHRLWHAPEAKPRTYYPDREPVLVQELQDGVVVTQKPEVTTGIQKQIEIRLAPDKAEVYLSQRLFNHNIWTIETAPWAITVMNQGGTAILPLPPRGPHPENLVPDCSISIWPYTNLADPRLILGEKFILIKQDPTKNTPQKIGIFTSRGWSAYYNHGFLFTKHVPIQIDGFYPDRGANFEVFTNDEILELETLGPIEPIPPRGHIELQEHWTLNQNIPSIEKEADVEQVLSGLES